MEKKYRGDTYESDDGIHWSKVEKDNKSVPKKVEVKR